MNMIPAASKARRAAKPLAAVIDVFGEFRAPDRSVAAGSGSGRSARTAAREDGAQGLPHVHAKANAGQPEKL
jgi:hypothetical protein